MAKNNFLFQEKPAKILILMLDDRERTVTILSRSLEMTFAHTIETINKYVKNSLITREKKGRKQILTLTKKGKEIAELVSKVWRKVNYKDG